VRVEIKRLHRELGATMVYVTHDQVEAMTLADQLVVLRGGTIEQVGAPLEVYHRPASRFVASFMGSPAMNFLRVERDGSTLRAPGVTLPMPQRAATDAEPGPAASNARELAADDAFGPASGGILLGVRPHDVRPVEAAGASLTMHVEVVEAMGFEAYAHGTIGGARFVARLEGADARGVCPGSHVGLAVIEGGVHLFDARTERALR
jgi:sn-glycerol 3-phosphate transport system ATP-binding protein/multiple sugar transport system ATP-binding protein